MERRQAMAASAMGALVLAAGVVTAKTLSSHPPAAPQTSATPVSQPVPPGVAPAPSGPPATIVVTRYEDVTDRYVIPTAMPAPLPSAGEGAPAASGGGTDPAPGSPQPGSTSTTQPPADSATPTTADPGTTTAGPGTETPPTSPSTTTTIRATTTTTTPGVPDDWPADKPIPPVPPGCRDPQLEDDGEWNCQH